MLCLRASSELRNLFQRARLGSTDRGSYASVVQPHRRMGARRPPFPLVPLLLSVFLAASTQSDRVDKGVRSFRPVSFQIPLASWQASRDHLNAPDVSGARMRLRMSGSRSRVPGGVLVSLLRGGGKSKKKIERAKQQERVLASIGKTPRQPGKHNRGGGTGIKREKTVRYKVCPPIFPLPLPAPLANGNQRLLQGPAESRPLCTWQAGTKGYLAFPGPHLYAIGGRAGRDDLTLVHRLDVTTDAWGLSVPLRAARSALHAVRVDGRIYAVGGMRTGTALGAMQSLAPLSGSHPRAARSSPSVGMTLGGATRGRGHRLAGGAGAAVPAALQRRRGGGVADRCCGGRVARGLGGQRRVACGGGVPRHRRGYRLAPRGPDADRAQARGRGGARRARVRAGGVVRACRGLRERRAEPGDCRELRPRHRRVADGASTADGAAQPAGGGARRAAVRHRRRRRRRRAPDRGVILPSRGAACLHSPRTAREPRAAAFNPGRRESGEARDRGGGG
jgi:hypothetical protein